MYIQLKFLISNIFGFVSNLTTLSHKTKQKLCMFENKKYSIFVGDTATLQYCNPYVSGKRYAYFLKKSYHLNISSGNNLCG